MQFRALLFACTCLAFGALLPGLSGCGTTPTLPLPPPVATIGSPNLQGLVQVSGNANPEAYVFVVNARMGAGDIKVADGETGYFEVEIPGEIGDTVLIWQEQDGITGERAQYTVPAPRP